MADLDTYSTILFHKNTAKAQRAAYKSHMSPEFLQNKILIELDFKQKIKIGLGPRQVSSEYYEQQERSCLGICFFFARFLIS